jgi:hypothetical protein
MASTRKPSPSLLIVIILLGALAGSLAWEVLERLIRPPVSLASGPLQLFDLYVVALTIRINPGSFLGAGAAALLARRL